MYRQNGGTETCLVNAVSNRLRCSLRCYCCIIITIIILIILIIIIIIITIRLGWTWIGSVDSGNNGVLKTWVIRARAYHKSTSKVTDLL